MNIKLLTVCLLFLCMNVVCAQTTGQINQTDSKGRKQGHWIRKYPNGNIMYDGFFRDDMPTGEFKRYYENAGLKSVLIFDNTGREASATLFYQNSLRASHGKYVNQLKEGKWQFFSSTNKDVLISEAYYSGDKKNGLSVKYYPDGRIAEKIYYLHDVRHGEWTKYYPDGIFMMKTSYVNGKLNGPFEAFFENGKPELSGQYKHDVREGLWIIYKKDGTRRFRTVYTLGIPDNREMEIYETNYLDSLEQNKQNIPDPEKTGNIW